MLHRRIRVHYEQQSEVEKGHNIEMVEAGGQIRELLIIWVKTVRPLEDPARMTTYDTCCYELSCSLSNTSLASQIASLSPIEHVWDMMGWRDGDCNSQGMLMI
ncbi:hypothetical protein TNCV_2098831 [Trichonephila clavipes]|nr:hypothetical protein TNCV_2098831 [Trichonephila clavipes]